MILDPVDYWRLKYLEAARQTVALKATLATQQANAAHAAFCAELAGRVEGFSPEGDYAFDDAAHALRPR